MWTRSGDADGRRALFARAIAALAILFALAPPAAARAAGPVEYYAAVDRDAIALDETLTLQVTLSFDQDEKIGELVLPEAPDFDVIRQGRSEQMSFAFGGGSPSFRKVRTHTLVLQPRREGKLVILPGRAVIGGKRYETGRITVEVGPAGSGARAQRGPGRTAPSQPPIPGFDDPFEDLLGGPPQASESDLFLRVTVDDDEVWVGEQVVLSVWLFSRYEVSHVEGLKMPRLDGFWAEELETPRQIVAQTRYVDGVPYRAYLIQRRALFPLRAGEIPIDPVELDISTGRSLFGRGRRHHRKSPGVTLQVKELPAGAPAAFRRGNVGQWSLQVEATPQEVAMGSPVTVRITASGTGNLQNLELPALGAIDGFKIFEPTRSEEVQIRDLRYGGSKTVEYVLVPERAGTFAIPGMTFVHFDPGQGTYQSQSTPPIALTVLPGAGSGHVAVAPAPPPAETATDGGLQPLRSAPVIVAPETPLYQRPWFVAALAAPLFAVLVAASPLFRRRLTPRRRRKAVEAGMPASLRELGERGDPAFFASCERLLEERASAALGRPARGLPRSELEVALVQAGVAAEAAAALAEAMAVCERARFAPGTATAQDVARARAAAERALSGLSEAA